MERPRKVINTEAAAELILENIGQAKGSHDGLYVCWVPKSTHKVLIQRLPDNVQKAFLAIALIDEVPTIEWYEKKEILLFRFISGTILAFFFGEPRPDNADPIPDPNSIESLIIQMEIFSGSQNLPEVRQRLGGV